jgi:hypothetical protein
MLTIIQPYSADFNSIDYEHVSWDSDKFIIFRHFQIDKFSKFWPKQR